ncbi:protein phosphatase 1 regulatory subunit 26 [Gastrophryne carolinensis]
MFLVNSPPVAAFSSQWMPFGPKVSQKVCFTKIKPVCQTAEPSHLLSILNGQKSDESSCSMSSNYERIMQQNKKGDLNYDRELKCSSVPSKRPQKELSTFPGPLKITKGRSQPCASEPDSDSDDSVDRDIEEAIQEYLKNKGTADSSPNTVAAKSSRTIEFDPNKPLSVTSNAPSRRSPVKIATSTATCNAFSPPDHSRCSSPESVDSDDSFEQSIKDEIEQFLNQKKLQSNTGETSDARKTTQSTTAVKPKQKSIKATEKQCPKQVNKGQLDKLPSECPNLPPQRSKQKAQSSRANAFSKSLSSLVKPSEPRKAAVLSAYEDSSSDDGIEEAIQLYQLEKNRLEGSLNVVQRWSPEGAAKKTASNTSLDFHKNADSRKRMLPFSRPLASQESSSGHVLAPKRALCLADDDDHKFEAAIHTTRRAETAAELMCAEAILDISKAILPSPTETTFVIPQEMSPAEATTPCVNDSSVDSDDSIEQEIRMFLARKAQTESVGTPSAKLFSHDRKQTSPSSNKTVLSQKGKLTASKAMKKEVLGKCLELDRRPLTEDVCVASTGGHLNERLQSKCSQTGLEDRSKPAIKLEEDSIQAAAESLVLLPGLTGNKRKMYTKTRGHSGGDKSSSLDSDEDLDSAIKDLLRSKRKIKKRPKDGRAPCKKKVRFVETTNRPLGSLGGDEKDCYPKAAVLKSCLVNSNPLQEESLQKSKTIVKVKEENVEVICDLSPKKEPECRPVSASDKSVKSTSALPEVQDSSSVDSDDSIEQEIRKFLAERARESAELSAMQKSMPNVTTSNFAIHAESPASLITPPPHVKQEPRVLSISETETILQKVMEKGRSIAPAPQPAVTQVQEPKNVKPQVRLMQRPPVEIPSISAPVHNVIVKSESFVEQNRLLRPSEKILSPAAERVNVKPGVNSSQGSPTVSGNFVAGLKYISGTDQQLLLNMGKAELYSPGANIAKLGTVQPIPKKTLILEPSKIVPAPTFSLGAPVVRPALYVVTTKMVKDAPAALCLPINTATYDAGLNLMSIQYCQSQVAPHASVCTTPFSFQPGRASEIVMNIQGTAREALPLHTKEKASQSATGITSRPCSVIDSSAKDVGTGSGHSVHGSRSSAKKHSLRRSIDPGWKLDHYIHLSPEEICKYADRKLYKMTSQEENRVFNLLSLLILDFPRQVLCLKKMSQSIILSARQPPDSEGGQQW